MSNSIPVQVNRSIRGSTVGTTGTGIFTLWGDIKSLSSKSTTLNPYAIEYSTLAADNACYVLDVPIGYNWLDTYQMLLNPNDTLAAINITTALKGVFFGKFPLHNPAERHQFTPRDAASAPSSTIASALSAAAARWSAAMAAPGAPGGGIWLPLDNPVSGTTEFTFPSDSPRSPVLRQDVGAATSNYPNIGGLTTTDANSIEGHVVTARTSVFLGGASRVMFLPTQAAALTANCEGVLIGRFVM